MFTVLMMVVVVYGIVFIEEIMNEFKGSPKSKVSQVKVAYLALSGETNQIYQTYQEV